MKKLLFTIIALSGLAFAQAQSLDRSIRPKPGPAAEIKLADPETFTLPNGLKVFVVENHKMPSVTYSIQLNIYPEAEGAQSGLSGFVGSLITSGTKNMKKDQFNEAVDQIGATLAASGQSIYGQSLTKHQDKLLALMSDVILHPDFKKDELDKLRKQTLAGFDANSNDPDFILSNVSRVVTYGPAHPYGEVPDHQTINNIKLEDCTKYFQTYFRPNVAYMAVVGDITLAQAKELVTKYFGKWEQAPVPKAEYPTAYAPARSVVEFVPRAGAVQSVIGITYPLVLKIGSPDVIKARALNEILGGSSQGRLFQNLRETHGWTYGAYSSLSADPVVGQFNAYIKCRNEVTDSSIAETLKEMEELRNHPVSKETLTNTLQYMAGVFALGLESPQTIAQYAINIDRFDMPKDYYKSYLKNLAAITPYDIQGMARKYLAPDNVNIVVVGNQTELSKIKRFSADSTVYFFDAFGKPVQSTESKIINGVTVQDVINKYIDAIGGKKAIESLKDIFIVSDIEVGRQGYTTTLKAISPDKILMEMKVIQQGGNNFSLSSNDATEQTSEVVYYNKMVINGDNGYSMQNKKKSNMPEGMVKDYKTDADLQVLLHPEKYAISYSLLGEENTDGEDCYTVEKGENEGRKKSIQYYSKNSGLLVKEIVTTDGGGGKKVEIKSYSDYKEVRGGSGYKIPYKTISLDPTQKIINVASARANSNIKESEFK